MTGLPRNSAFCFRIWKVTCLSALLIWNSQAHADDTPVVSTVATRWRFFAGAAAPDASWMKVEFDDSRWSTGRVEYHDGVQRMRPDLSRVRSLESKLLFRGHFVVADPDTINQLTIEIASESPVVVYLNGIAAFRSQIPLPFSVDLGNGDISGYPLDLGGYVEELLPGNNVISVEVTNNGRAGGTLVFVPKLYLTHRAGESQDRMIESALSDAPDVVPKRSKASLQTGDCCAEYVVVMIADGRGAKQIEATNQFTGIAPSYQSDSSWWSGWMSTFPLGGEYDGGAAWIDFDYVLQNPTDSAAAATAMYSGVKTQNGKISVEADRSARLFSIGELARQTGKAVGAVTTVAVSHATPGAWTSHNEARSNTYAIADEAFFEDPNTTGTVTIDPKYGGGYGPTRPSADVLIGGRSGSYVHASIRDKLASESGLSGKHTLVEGASGIDGGSSLLSAAEDPLTLKLAGLFDRVNLRATAVDNGYVQEIPTLAESTH